MGTKTAIDNVDHTQNFWVGCQPVSEGCLHCYAKAKYDGWNKDFTVVRRTDTWKDPSKWQREAFALGEVRKVFTCSMGDFFHQRRGPVAAGSLEDYQGTRRIWLWRLLTKRAEFIADRLPQDWGRGYPNVWLGVPWR